MSGSRATAAEGLGGPRLAVGWSLTAKQALVTLAVVLALGVVGGAVEILLDWRAMRAEVDASATQLLGITRGAAAEAAYQLNPDLAAQVVAGLLEYGAVEQAELVDERGEALARRSRGSVSAQDGLAEWLFGDVVHHELVLRHPDRGNVLGDLRLILSPDTVAHSFFRRIWVGVGLGAFKAVVICGLVVGVFYAMITRPILRLSEAVARIDPDQPGLRPVRTPAGHGRDELGVLIASLNGLLAASQRGLDQRDRAETDLKALTHELEHRVEERTRALAGARDEILQLNNRLEAENSRLGAELDVSRRIQRMILPTAAELAAIPHLDVAAYMEPAQEVGGDYYDILAQNGRVRIGIGDVTGHGLESGVVSLMIQSATRTLITSEESDARRLMDVLNRTIHGNILRMGSDKNLTFSLLDYRHEPLPGNPTGAVAHLRITGQHESVLIVRAGGRVEVIDTLYLGMPLALVDDLLPYVGEQVVSIHQGDVIVLYTDGITEAADPDHCLYGVERLCGILSARWQDDAATIKDAVIADVHRHVGTQEIFDDLTLVVMKQR